MREIRQSGSAGGEVQINEPSLPLSSSNSRAVTLSLRRWQTNRRNTEIAAEESQEGRGTEDRVAAITEKP